MEAFYKVYKYKRCKKEVILITDEVVDTIRKSKYISCSHCGSKEIVKDTSVSDLRRCMEHSAYKRVKGAIRQVR
ncbi:hypothetical protein [Clostridium beijerinckii]|uniref:hypothetical protein n=1 Tax=Clostridium beijerinckii TaxID=1520 RepID=UPI0015703997|nr:hypothetical protein [Clostridium beijerinckii]NRT70023.1 DNA-directed RNA polymerase subunit RPC12/RpoP [Clostridium beijerinckii]